MSARERLISAYRSLILKNKITIDKVPKSIRDDIVVK